LVNDEPSYRRASDRPLFVGRALELRQILRTLRTAARGPGQVLVVRGPAGIGKTRLAEEVATRARRRGARVGVGWCWQDGEPPPLWPWRAILSSLGVPESTLDDRAGEARPGRFACFLTVADHLRAAARATPLAVILDDVHLADPATLLLARFIARAGSALPLLLVLTHRDETEALADEARELLAELARGAAVITLAGLSEDDVSAYIAASGLRAPERHLLRAVTAVTQGNPLHLRSVTLQSRLEPAGVRGGLERAIEGLLECLAPEDRRLVALAALLGTEVSVHEVAHVAEVSPASATESLTHAARLGLATEGPAGRFSFVHELLRRAALCPLDVAERLDAHARAATLWAGPEPDRLSRRAHHALAASSRSQDDAQTAVTIARQVAGSLRAVDGYEAAASLLERAAEIQVAAMLDGPAAELAVEWAESVLACGRLAEARSLFHRAARLAEAEDDPLVLARAALGLGGVWVREHRIADESERVLALQRRALQGLPPAAVVLRARLAVRLAAEEAYHGASLTPVLAALEAARRTGDAHALAEALSLSHHALMTPQHTWSRLPLANELIATAALAGDGLLALVGLCWRAADLFLLGDPGAAGALAELRLRADALHCRSIFFMAEVMDVMLAIREGRFEQAEAAAAACFELGGQVGDADALAYHGAHLVAIRSFQGREAELAGLAADIAASPTLIEEGARAFAFTAALLSLRAGRPEAARGILDRLAQEGLASLPASSSWLGTLLVVVELAFALGDARIAQAAYDELLPYADLPIMASLACVCFGSAQRVLGLAALTVRRLDLALEHFAAAVKANERLGHRPAAIQARAELGLAHLRRAQAGDASRGQALLQEAIAAARTAGMDGLVARWRGTQEDTMAARARAVIQPAEARRAENGRWRVLVDGEAASVPDWVGMRYLARLLSMPGRAISALALATDGAADPHGGRAEAVIDRKALAALRARIREIEQQPTGSPREQEELAALKLQLGRTLGLGGRIRSFADAPERARTAVRKAIKRVLDEISASNPAVSRHLVPRIVTGSVCCYRLENEAWQPASEGI
jgi:tetratricopeptide (TPR) repeat protein